MEPEISLPHSQKPVTCPYPEPEQYIPCLPIPLIADPFYSYPPIYAWAFQVVSFVRVFPPKPRMFLSWPPYVPHAPSISLDLITRNVFGEEYRAWSFALWSLLHSSDNIFLLGPTIFLSAQFSNTLSLSYYIIINSD